MQRELRISEFFLGTPREHKAKETVQEYQDKADLNREERWDLKKAEIRVNHLQARQRFAVSTLLASITLGCIIWNLNKQYKRLKD